MWKRRTKGPVKDAAAKAGLRFYTPENICLNGHQTDRYTASGACVACEQSRYDTRTGLTARSVMQSVYVFTAGSAVKIGIAANIKVRRQVTQTHCPHPVGVYFATEPMPQVEAKQIESQVGARFAHACLHGSWFSVSGETLKLAIEEARLLA